MQSPEKQDKILAVVFSYHDHIWEAVHQAYPQIKWNKL